MDRESLYEYLITNRDKKHNKKEDMTDEERKKELKEEIIFLGNNI
ncbi:hypothetical protein [Mammaliicoccus sp. M-M47]|nr:hypothetical protein [Mammaliicoccus sp. M-M47]